MLRCGIDLVEVGRVGDAIRRHGDRFLRRVFTPDEIRYCQTKVDPWPHYAARFAAKEAFFKSLVPGTLEALIWREVGVGHHASGAPSLEFSGTTRERLQGWRFQLSLSHVREMALAQVLALPPGERAPR
ncbi:MAG: holo-ACP synthase [Candidatus Krumholzibacteriia bacterium]